MNSKRMSAPAVVGVASSSSPNKDGSFVNDDAHFVVDYDDLEGAVRMELGSPTGMGRSPKHQVINLNVNAAIGNYSPSKHNVDQEPSMATQLQHQQTMASWMKLPVGDEDEGFESEIEEACTTAWGLNPESHVQKGHGEGSGNNGAIANKKNEKGAGRYRSRRNSTASNVEEPQVVVPSSENTAEKKKKPFFTPDNVTATMGGLIGQFVAGQGNADYWLEREIFKGVDKRVLTSIIREAAARESFLSAHAL